MKIQKMVKQASIGLAAIGFLWSNPVSAQVPAKTPVNTSVHLSGSCAKCDLSRRVMPGMSLQGANFSGSDFSHSNLAGANFNQASLDNTSFFKAHLMQVEGERVNLNKSVLRSTTLSNVRLVSSNFTLADLHKSDLSGGDFTASDFTKARLKSVDAIGAVFIHANFNKARLDHGDFTGSNFSGAQFIHTKFGDAVVENADFTGADFSGAEMVDIIGLTQSQLDKACGSQKTQLPEGYSMRVCPPKTKMLADVEQAAPVPSPPVVGSMLTPRAPRPLMMTRTLIRRDKLLVIRSTELNEIMSDINGALDDLPMGSPTRIKLEKSRRKLEQVQAQTDYR